MEAAVLRPMEMSSDSWTIETPERTSSSSSEGAFQQAHGDEGLKEVDWYGGGEWEEAPNNQDGGSSLVASLRQRAVGRAPHAKGYMETLTEAILHKIEVEEILLKADQDDRMIDQKEMEEEFLVTRTISTKEVMEILRIGFHQSQLNTLSWLAPKGPWNRSPRRAEASC